MPKNILAANKQYHSQGNGKWKTTALAIAIAVIPWEAGFTSFSKDGNDLSILTPSADSRIVFVDDILGNDSTAVNYGGTIPNPYTYTPANPYLTIPAATAQLRDGYPDWILLKSGGSWDTSIPIGGISGRSDSDRSVLATYGGAARAEIRSFQTTSRCLSYHKKEHLAIQGIDLYNPARDPNAPEFVGYGFTGEVLGIYHFSNTAVGDEEKSNTLIENCRIRYFSGGISYSGQAGGVNNVVRNNIIQYTWGEDAHSQGIWSDHREMLTENNVLDHNGWLIKSFDGGNDQGQATVFNHNIYWSGTRNSIIRDNIISRASSIGIKLTANPAGPADTIEAYNVYIGNNFFYAGEVGITAGGNTDFNTGPRFQNMNIVGNVFKAIGIEQPTNRTLAWYTNILDWEGTTFRDNYLLHENTNPAVVSILAIGVSGHTSNLQLVENYCEGFPEPIADDMNIQPEDFVNVTVNDPIDLVSAPTMANFLADQGVPDWPAYIDSISIPGKPPTDYFINGAVK